MNINRIQSNQNRPAFTALKINEPSIREAGTKVFNGVRQTLIPEEGKLSSKLQRLAEGTYCNVHIGSRSPKEEILNFSVSRGNNTMHVDRFETKEYNSEVELGNAITQKIEDTYHAIGRSSSCLCI